MGSTLPIAANIFCHVLGSDQLATTAKLGTTAKHQNPILSSMLDRPFRSLQKILHMVMANAQQNSIFSFQFSMLIYTLSGNKSKNCSHPASDLYIFICARCLSARANRGRQSNLPIVANYWHIIYIYIICWIKGHLLLL